MVCGDRSLSAARWLVRNFDSHRPARSPPAGLGRLTAGHLAARPGRVATGRRWGARIYLAVAGGLAADRWLGSAATYVLVGRGGVHGRALQAGDELELAGPPPRPLVAGRCLPEPLRPAYRAEPELAAVDGPHLGHLSAASRRQRRPALRRRPCRSTGL